MNPNKHYIVKSGDTMSNIAKKHNVSMQDVMSANPSIKNPDMIFPKDTVYIPVMPTYTAPQPQPATTGIIDTEEIKRRQGWTESRFEANAQSGVGAKGVYQIMPDAYAEFVKATGRTGDLFDPQFNAEVRDWYMNKRIPQWKYINKGEPTDSVKMAKILAQYNAGAKSVINALNRAKADGIDIYKSLDWIPYMSKEPRDYVNFILRNKDTGAHRTAEHYNAFVNSNKEK